ncbi:glycosyltransferase family 39 protein, partial [Candidatus Sumerlaeota bacterium]|nr:glycosyltransferase family 39 protein [Candidatus Sumerlaeota bacterium]
MTEIGNSPALPASPLRHGVGLASEWYARRELPMLALLAIGAFLINLGRGFEENEYITNWVCTMDRNTLIQNRFNAGHFPYWFLWMQFWTTHLGDSEIIYRLPSVAAVVAAVFAFRATVRELFDLDRARLAALIFTIHQLTIWCAQTARPWSGILLCGALLTWGVMRWIHSRDWRWLILIAAATFVGYAHHPNFVFGVAAIAFPLLYLAVRRCAVGITPLAAMLFSILMQSHATVVLAGKQDDIVVTHEFHFRLKQGLNAASQLWFGDWKLWTEDWAKYTALLLIILASVAFWRATRSASSFHSAGLQNQPLNQCPLPPRHWSAFQRIFVLSWIWTPWTIILIIASGYAHHPMLSQIRYQTLAIGGIATLLAVAIAWWLQETGASGRKWRLIPLGAVCFLLLANT